MTPEEAKLTIEYLKEMQEEYIEGEGYERHPLPEWYALDKAIEAIEQTTWIPVSERLPEDKQSVLVWCPQYKNIYCAYLEKKQWWIFGAFVQIVPNEVVEWMPLPKFYKPQESEDKE